MAYSAASVSSFVPLEDSNMLALFGSARKLFHSFSKEII